MMFGLEKGSFGYIKKKKARQALHILVLLVVAAVMFITGLFIHEFDKANICTVLAVLMLLPAVKTLVLLIVVFPYRSVSKERYDVIKGSISDNTILMTDMVITSSEHVMNLDFVLVTDNQVLGLIGKKKQDVAYIEGYLKETLENNKINGFTVKIFEEQKQFEKCITDRAFEATDMQDECFRLIRTLVV